MKKSTKSAPLPPALFTPTAPEHFIGPAGQIARILAAKAKALNDLGQGTAKILLLGPPGTGKTTLANMFAGMLAGHPSQIESVNGRNVNLDLVRQWQDAMRYCPLWGKFSVRIVNEMDTCPAAAQDLLLTFLDELPANTAFVGTSNLDLREMTERFQSRLQQFRVGNPVTEDVAAFLAKWNIKPQTASQIAVGSGGNVRAALLDAQGILDARLVA